MTKRQTQTKFGHNPAREVANETRSGHNSVGDRRKHGHKSASIVQFISCLKTQKLKLCKKKKKNHLIREGRYVNRAGREGVRAGRKTVRAGRSALGNWPCSCWGSRWRSPSTWSPCSCRCRRRTRRAPPCPPPSPWSAGYSGQTGRRTQTSTWWLIETSSNRALDCTSNRSSEKKNIYIFFKIVP